MAQTGVLTVLNQVVVAMSGHNSISDNPMKGLTLVPFLS